MRTASRRAGASETAVSTAGPAGQGGHRAERGGGRGHGNGQRRREHTRARATGPSGTSTHNQVGSVGHPRQGRSREGGHADEPDRDAPPVTGVLH